jgi:flagellin
MPVRRCGVSPNVNWKRSIEQTKDYAMNTSSVLTNSSALTALESLNQTEQALNQTQNEVSTGLAVSSAADNAAYWSIATQLSADGGVVSAVNDALSESTQILSTATSAINSIITTINSIETALTQASNPGADLTDINTTLSALGQQLLDAVNGASFNGVNLLNGSQDAAALDFVSGFNATSTGGSLDTVSFQSAALYNAGAGTLVQNGTDLTQINVTTAAAATTALTNVQSALTAVTQYSSLIGSTQDRMNSAENFNSALSTDYTNGVSGLVDADMNEASTRLQALQTQQQLGIQSLSIANQNSQLILKLFQS